jgi:2-polyprenyl-6-hydroxyphenyl methylase/3-demethylubiquinone-9 3-methyltransferase
MGTQLSEDNPRGYQFSDPKLSYTHSYLWPVIAQVLRGLPPPRRIFDLGCGNGSTAHALWQLGYEVEGVDPSEEGIALARATYPECRLEPGSAYEDLSQRFGSFDCVISLEVVEHLYYPRQFALSVKGLLKPGGVGIISTPYHGYAKNLILALLGKMDSHFNPLWDYGHIKFWSRRTLELLFSEVNLRPGKFCRVGRFPQVAKSMVLVVHKDE